MKNKMSRFVFLTACICILSCILVACDSGSNAATEASTEAAEAVSTTEDSETADSEDVAAILIGSEDAELSEESEETDESGNSEATEEEQGLTDYNFRYDILYYDGNYYFSYFGADTPSIIKYNESTGEQETITTNSFLNAVSNNTLYYTSKDKISALCVENNSYIEDITNGKLQGYSIYGLNPNNGYITFLAAPSELGYSSEEEAGAGEIFDYPNIVVTSAYNGEADFNPTTYFIPNDGEYYIFSEDFRDAYVDGRDLYIFYQQGGYGDDFIKINLDDFTKERTTRLNLVDGFNPIIELDYKNELAYLLSNKTGSEIKPYTIEGVCNNHVIVLAGPNANNLIVYDMEGNIVKQVTSGLDEYGYSTLRYFGCCNNHVLYSNNGTIYCDELVP